MAITKIGNQLEKQAARWHELYNNLSDAAKQRILNYHWYEPVKDAATGMLTGVKRRNLVKPEEEIIKGIEQGNDNLVKRLGYTEFNVNGPTPEQFAELRKNLADQVEAAKQSGDIAGWRRNVAALTMLDIDLRNDINKFYKFFDDLKGTDSLSAQTYGLGKILFTKNFSDKNPYLNAIARRHELYEAAASEKSLLDFFGNAKKVIPRMKVNEKHHENKLRFAGGDEKNIEQKISELKLNNGLPSIHYNTDSSGRWYLETKNDINRINAHYDSNVLYNEMKDMARFPYKNNEGYKILNDMREYTTLEYPVIKEGLKEIRGQKPGMYDSFLEGVAYPTKNEKTKLNKLIRRGIKLDPNYDDVVFSMF